MLYAPLLQHEGRSNFIKKNPKQEATRCVCKADYLLIPLLLFFFVLIKCLPH